MRKILFFMLLLVQLTAATAFAYTNKEDGCAAYCGNGVCVYQ